MVRTAYDDKVEGQSVMPTRGFGDLYYKQRKGDDGLLLPPALQVCACVLARVPVPRSVDRGNWLTERERCQDRGDEK